MVMKPQFGLLFCPKYLMISHFLSKRPTFFSSFHKHLKDKIFKDNGDFSDGSAGKELPDSAEDARE